VRAEVWLLLHIRRASEVGCRSIRVPDRMWRLLRRRK
jgi:hypothetical protein